MPTYEYQCSKCGHTFDVFQSMTDKRLSKCPKCKGKLKRLLGSGAGIIFKGTGFYQTDYKAKNASSLPAKPSETGNKSSESKKD